MSFAEQYPRTAEGWIKFPPQDDEERKRYFTPESIRHPAKANIWLIDSIVSHVSQPGQTLLDIMSGTGTLMLAALAKRRVILIDIEKTYVDMMQASLELMANMDSSILDRVVILHGDCRNLLPIPVDHIIFSPPYADIMRRKTKPKTAADKDLAGPYADSIQEYQESPNNLGRLPEFFYNHAMEKIYELCFQSVKPGGTLTVIIKDHTEKGERVFLSSWMQRACMKAGFYPKEWHKWLTKGTGYLELWKSRGYKMVDDEDIVLMTRP